MLQYNAVSWFLCSEWMITMLKHDCEVISCSELIITTIITGNVHCLWSLLKCCWIQSRESSSSDTELIQLTSLCSSGTVSSLSSSSWLSSSGVLKHGCIISAIMMISSCGVFEMFLTGWETLRMQTQLLIKFCMSEHIMKHKICKNIQNFEGKATKLTAQCLQSILIVTWSNCVWRWDWFLTRESASNPLQLK